MTTILDRALYNIVRPFAPDWFAARWTHEHAERIYSAKTVTQIVSKIGVHCVGGNRTGFGPFLQTINAAGRKLSVVVCYDDFGAAWECKQLWPDVKTVGMLTSTDYGFDYAAFVRKAHQNPWIDWWAIYNEIGGQTASEYAHQANDYIALMTRMAADSLRLGMFSTASGTPPLPSEDGGACYAEIARACAYSKANNYQAILLQHEYQSVGTIGRYQNLRDYLIAHNAIIPIVISEFGFETFPGTASMMSMIRANDPIYMADGWCDGCANWTLGGGGWAGSNYAPALPELGEYIATVPPIHVPPPPEPTVIGSVSCPQSEQAVVETAILNAGGKVEWY